MKKVIEYQTGKKIRTLENFLADYPTPQRVFFKADFNVPYDENLQIASTFRIDRTIDDIKKVVSAGHRVALFSHLGNPKNGYEEKKSLKHIVPYLSEKLGLEVVFVENCFNPELIKEVNLLVPYRQIILCENVRFYKEEKSKDEVELMSFAHGLALPFDVMINSAFGSAHRRHASNAVGEIIPCYAGDLLVDELQAFGGLFDNMPEANFAIIGGSKVSSKLSTIRFLIPRFEKIFICGGMAHTFLKLFGWDFLDKSNSCVEDDMLDTCDQIWKEAIKHKCVLVFPEDVVVGKINETFSGIADASEIITGDIKYFSLNPIPRGYEVLDAGPKTVAKISKVIGETDFIFWNGPLGVFEVKPFAQATGEVMNMAVCRKIDHDMSLYIGGGDTSRFFYDWKAENAQGTEDTDLADFISTGGGAAMEYLIGETLYGVQICLT